MDKEEIQTKSEETTKVDTELENTQAPVVDNGASENSDASKTENVNDVEFTDTDKDETPKSEEKKPQDNSENARRRREAERQAELKKTRYEAIKEATDGVNPYTNEPMVDEVDIEEYLAMKEIAKKGGDPLKDFAKFTKDKQKEELKIKQQEEEQDDWINKDYEDFRAKYPKVDLTELDKDENFKAFAEDKVGKVPMSQIYASYQDLVSNIQKKERQEAARLVANAKASPGSLTSPETSDNDFFTREQVAKMSQEEVHKNYDKIRKSMTKWN